MIAEKLKVERSTLTEYLQRHPDLLKFIEEAEEAILDLAENKLFTKIASGDQKAIKFFLERKAKKRGYAQKQEVEQIGKDPVQLIIEYAKDDDKNPTDKETDNSDAFKKPEH